MKVAILVAMLLLSVSSPVAGQSPPGNQRDLENAAVKYLRALEPHPVIIPMPNGIAAAKNAENPSRFMPASCLRDGEYRKTEHLAPLPTQLAQ